jgi:hypothetical protein
MDSAAMGLAWFIIVAVPIGGIVLFWMVHVLPEKIAHKRHHMQRDAIQVLCPQRQLALLSVRTTLLRLQTERLAQRINLHLALGGGFGPSAMAAVARQ